MKSQVLDEKLANMKQSLDVKLFRYQFIANLHFDEETKGWEKLSRN